MKHIKPYKNINCKIGDLVICKDRIRNNDKLGIILYEFLSNNVGEIIKINDIDYIGYKYIVRYYNIPDILKEYFVSFGEPDSRGFDQEEIIKVITDPEIIKKINLDKNIYKFNL